MKIRKSLIAVATAATVTAGLAAPTQAETHAPATQVQAAETPKTKSPLGSLDTIFENTPAWLRVPFCTAGTHIRHYLRPSWRSKLHGTVRQSSSLRRQCEQQHSGLFVPVTLTL